MVEKQGDHLFDRQEADPLSRQTHETIDRGRNQDQRLQAGAIGYPLQFEDEAKAAIGDKRKGMGGVDRERRQHRKDVRHEPLLEPGAVAGFELGRFDDGDAGLAELSAQAHPGDLLIRHQLAGSLPDRLELLGGRQPVLAHGLDAGEILAFEPGHPHHIEFVEIVRRDRQEAQPFEQRMAQVVGLGENALVEGEPGELPVDEACLGMEIDRLDLDWPRAGSHWRSPGGCSTRILSHGYGPVMLPPGLSGATTDGAEPIA